MQTDAIRMLLTAIVAIKDRPAPAAFGHSEGEA
jgi:hypothetical protein